MNPAYLLPLALLAGAAITIAWLWLQRRAARQLDDVRPSRMGRPSKLPQLGTQAVPVKRNWLPEADRTNIADVAFAAGEQSVRMPQALAVVNPFPAGAGDAMDEARALWAKQFHAGQASANEHHQWQATVVAPLGYLAREESLLFTDLPTPTAQAMVAPNLRRVK